MRWPQQRRQTSDADADGEVVWFWRPDAGVKFLGSQCFSGMTGARKPGPREEHEANRNTIVQGMPDCFGLPVVTLLVCFFISHARLRVRRASGIPCALCCRREIVGKARAYGVARRRKRVLFCLHASAGCCNPIQFGHSGARISANAESRDSPMRNCASAVWSLIIPE
jgi:hypothetical protein